MPLFPATLEQLCEKCDELKGVFATPSGNKNYRMVYGLYSAPAVFQSLNTAEAEVLWDVLGRFVIVYIKNDILIHFADRLTQIHHLRMVMPL